MHDTASPSTARTAAPAAADLGVPNASEPVQDLSALAWVHDEVRRTLESALKSLRRFVRESRSLAHNAIDAPDPAVLRQARTLIHQTVGALEMVGQPVPAKVLRAGEAVVARIGVRSEPGDEDALQAVERLCFALLDYLKRLLGGRPLSPLALYPAYEAAQQLGGAGRIHPADLWPQNAGAALAPARADAPAGALDARTRSDIERDVLAVMKGPASAAAQRLSDTFAALAAADPAAPGVPVVWQLAAACFEALALGHIQSDMAFKRLASALMSHVRRLERSPAEPVDTLVRELLFTCAVAADAPGADAAPRVAAARADFALVPVAVNTYQDVRLGRFDPAWLPLARKRVSALKDSWSGWAAGETRPFAALAEQSSLVADSLVVLFPKGERLGRALQAVMAAQGRAASAVAAQPEVALEVATVLLYVEASLDEAALDRPELPGHVEELAARLDRLLSGRKPAPIEPWMEALYREVSDQQTIGSVVHELRSALVEIETHIDRFARKPTEVGALMPVPGQLASMRGVLSVLGLDHAAQALVRMRDDIDLLVASGGTAALPDAKTAAPTAAPTAQPAVIFERLAENVGAMGFLIDMLGVQPQLAKTLFRLDPDSGRFGPAVGLSRAPLADALAVSALPGAAHDESRDAPPARPPMTSMPSRAPVQAHVSASTTPAPAADVDDEDMRAVFIEEAQEVLAEADSALQALREQGDDLSAFTVIRRAFHTLKGSSRMVGLTAFGDAAWAFEQLYNMRLAEPVVQADGPLCQGTAAALSDMTAWVDELAGGGHSSRDAAGLIRAAHALRERPGAAVVGEVVFPDLPDFADLPERADLPVVDDAAAGEWSLDLPEVFEEPAESIEQPPQPLAEAKATPATPDAHAEPESRPDDADVPGLLIDLSDFDGPAPAALAHAEDTVQAAALTPHADAPEPDGLGFELDLDLDLDLDLGHDPKGVDLPPVPDAAPPSDPTPLVDADADQFKMVGPLRVSIPLFNIFLNEADEWSRLLGTALAEWSHQPSDPPDETLLSTAHALAGSAATVGYRDLSDLARALEHALERIGHRGSGDAAEMPVLIEGGEQIRYLLHQFAAGFLKDAAEGLRDRLESLARSVPAVAQMAPDVAATATATAAATGPAALRELSAVRLVPLDDANPAAPTEDGDGFESALAQAAAAAAHSGAAVPFSGRDDLSGIDVQDALDDDLYPIFAEEADELLPRLAEHMRRWVEAPQDRAPAVGSLRVLHTLKGSARLAGAMRLGEMAHRLEGGVEAAVRDDPPSIERLEALQAGVDRLVHEAQQLRGVAAAATEDDSPAADLRSVDRVDAADWAALDPAPSVESESPPELSPDSTPESLLSTDQTTEPVAAVAPQARAVSGIDWAAFAESASAPATGQATAAAAATGVVRVRAGLLDRLVAHAGEISIARARLDADVAQIRGAARDLNDNLERLRRQLRDIELQGETQIASRMEAAKSASQQFDPLELDRFTRFQELTRMMAESVNDVATVQRSLQHSVQAAEDDLVAQSRTARALQDDLLRARMVEFDSLSERLYRVVRQAARERGRQVRLDIEGAGIEMDRGVLERLAGCFEHLLRNAVAHGIEDADARVAAGKDAVGSITVSLAQEGNEVAIVFRDDGGGLDLPGIRARAEALGLVSADAPVDDAALAAMIFRPGFSTAAAVTELAGRGIGMDVVRDEVAGLGGRIETATTAGRGTAFRLVVPLTTAVTQVVMVRCGGLRVALPASVVELLRRVPSAQVAQAYADGALGVAEGGSTHDAPVPFFWLGALLQAGRPDKLVGKTQAVLWVRSASQRVALHVDQVVGQQEVVVKHLGPQLARLPGLTGVSQLASGDVVLIYNPVALAAVYGAQVQRVEAERAQPASAAEDSAGAAPSGPVLALVAEPAQAPLVMVVDDSLTVRRVTQRLLSREGYRVVLAKDGLEAIDRLADERPMLLLTDIEMPRMDGFELVRHVRADRDLTGLPIVMITSRIAERHREHAIQLGVDHYLGKPYSEDELLKIVRQHAPVSVA